MNKNKLLIGLGGVGTNQLKKSILDSLNNPDRPNRLIVDCSDIKNLPDDYDIICKDDNKN